MRLVQLTANKSTFKPVVFNERGLSVIVAKKKTNEEKGTYNSVGKSLTVSLIHFCLGSSSNDEFKDKLSDWVFTLDLIIDKEELSVSRSTEKQDFVTLNGKELGLTEYTKLLGRKVFGIQEKTKHVTFRSQIARFIRPQKACYNNSLGFVYKEQPFPQLLNNARLMGIDLSLIQKKNELRENQRAAQDRKRALENDSVLRSFFQASENVKSVELEIATLRKKVSRLENDLGNFDVAEDYYEIKQEADEISKQLKDEQNKASRIKRKLGLISDSLNTSADLSKKKLLDFYETAGIQLHSLIKKRLDELESFNNKLSTSRKANLEAERNRLNRQYESVNGKVKYLGDKENDLLRYLNTKGALDEYHELNTRYGDEKKRLEKLTEFDELSKKYKKEIDKIKESLARENVNTNNYLELEGKEVKDKNLDTFLGLVEHFYKDKVAGVTIENNDGENTTRFNIEVKIQDDSGDGVNYIKMFCFDLTLLLNQFNHNVKFLFHDSRILAECDERQTAMLFEIAHQQTLENDFQYIISANSKDLKAVEDLKGGTWYKEIIEENEILELSDDSDEGRLLGIHVDLVHDNTDS